MVIVSDGYGAIIIIRLVIGSDPRSEVWKKLIDSYRRSESRKLKSDSFRLALSEFKVSGRRCKLWK